MLFPCGKGSVLRIGLKAVHSRLYVAFQVPSPAPPCPLAYLHAEPGPERRSLLPSSSAHIDSVRLTEGNAWTVSFHSAPAPLAAQRAPSQRLDLPARHRDRGCACKRPKPASHLPLPFAGLASREVSASLSLQENGEEWRRGASPAPFKASMSRSEVGPSCSLHL